MRKVLDLQDTAFEKCQKRLPSALCVLK